MEVRRRNASALWLRFSPISGQTPASVEPCDRSFDDPAFGFDDEALGMLASLDDFDRQPRHRLGGAGMEDWSRIGAVGEQLAQKGNCPNRIDSSSTPPSRS